MKKSLCFILGFVCSCVFQDSSPTTQTMIAKSRDESLLSMESSKGTFPSEIEQKVGFDVQLKIQNKELRFEGLRVCKGISVAWITEESVLNGLTEPEYKFSEPMRAIVEAWLNLKISSASLTILKNSDTSFFK